MKNENRNSEKRLLCTALAVIMVLSVCAAGVVPVSAEEVTRSVEPDSVAPGEVVDVAIEFTTTKIYEPLMIIDYVPSGWDVPEEYMRVNEEANATLFDKWFDDTKGMVRFTWLSIPAGIYVKAEYKLHVPVGAEAGGYTITGKLICVDKQGNEEHITIPAGTVVVKSEYDVDLTVDEDEKTTDSNVNATYYITVENRGTESDTYALSITANEAEDAWLNKTSVSLGGGESEVVELNVSSFLAGDYSTTVEASSANASDEVTVTTTVSAFYEVDLEVTPEEQPVAPDETATYTLTVENTGNTADTFDLAIEEVPTGATATLSVEVTPELAPGGTGTYVVFLNVSSAIEDEYIVNVTATSQGNISVSDKVTTTTTVSVTPQLSITITSPEGRTYASICVRLNFIVEPEDVTPDWIGYSLDGEANVTITGNTTVSGLGSAPYGHNIVVYANDTSGTMAASNKVFFTVHPGDIKDDGIVNLDDLMRLAGAAFSEPGDDNWDEDANLNCDSTINLDDLMILADNAFKEYSEPT